MNPELNDKGNRIDELVIEIRGIISSFNFGEYDNSNPINRMFNEHNSSYINRIIDDMVKEYNNKIDLLEANKGISLAIETEDFLYLNLINKLTSIKEELENYLNLEKLCFYYIRIIDAVRHNSKIDDPLYEKLHSLKLYLEHDKDKENDFNLLLDEIYKEMENYLDRLKTKLNNKYFKDSKLNELYEIDTSINPDEIIIPSSIIIKDEFETRIRNFSKNAGISLKALNEEGVTSFKKVISDEQMKYLLTLVHHLDDLAKELKLSSSQAICFNPEIAMKLKKLAIASGYKEYQIFELKDMDFMDNVKIIQDLFSELEKIKFRLKQLEKDLKIDSSLKYGLLDPSDSKNPLFIKFTKTGIIGAILDDTGKLTDYAKMTGLSDSEINKKNLAEDPNNKWIKKNLHRYRTIFGFRPCIKVDDIEELRGCKEITDASMPTYEYGEYPTDIVDINDSNRNIFVEDESKFTGKYIYKFTDYNGDNDLFPENMKVYENNGLRYTIDGDKAYIIKPIRWLYDKKTRMLISEKSLALSFSRSVYGCYLEEAFKRDFVTPEMMIISNPVLKDEINNIENLLKDSPLKDSIGKQYSKLYNEIIRFILIKNGKDEKGVDIYSDEMLYDPNDGMYNFRYLYTESRIPDEIKINEYRDKLLKFKDNMISCQNTYLNANKLINIIEEKNKEGELAKDLKSITYIFGTSIKSASLLDDYNKIKNAEISYLSSIIEDCKNYDFSKPFIEINYEELENDFRSKIHPFLINLNSINNNDVELVKVIEEKKDNSISNSLEHKMNAFDVFVTEILGLNPSSSEIDRINQIILEKNSLDDKYSSNVDKINALLELEKQIADIYSDIKMRMNQAKYKENYKSKVV